MVIIVLLNVAWICATPCGTTRFSRFFLNSFLRFDTFSGAFVASCWISFAKSVPSIQLNIFSRAFMQAGVTCEPRPSWRPLRPFADLSAFAHLYGCVDRGREGCGDDASHGNTGSRSAAGCSSGPPCGDRPRRVP